jgi:mediator of RNA polymerase II transcription subunit 11
VSALRTAATAINHLTPRRSSEESSTMAFNMATTEFLQLVKEIHTELASHIHLVSDYRTYGRSTYGAEKDATLAREKVKIVLEQLQSVTRYLDDHIAPEEN